MVEAISLKVHRRTINVMDMDGIIIASTDPERIGTMHTGARKVAETGKDLLITTDMLSAYPGCREGYNTPLFCQGEMIGVIGIFGRQTDVMELANLLRIYAEKYFELETVMNRRLADTELKGRLFRLLSGEKTAVPEKILQFFQLSKMQPQYPLLCVRLLCPEAVGEDAQNSWKSEALLEKLEKLELIKHPEDIYGLEGNKLKIIKSADALNSDNWVKELQEVIRSLSFQVRVIISEPIERIAELQEIWQKVRWADYHMKEAFLNLSDSEDHIAYMLARSAAEEERFIERYTARLNANIKQKELPAYINCMKCYLDEGKSVTQAAKKLFIHKNTLQYRVKRLYEAAGLIGENDFMREYLMRLIINHLNSHYEAD